MLRRIDQKISQQFMKKLNQELIRKLIQCILTEGRSLTLACILKSGTACKGCSPTHRRSLPTPLSIIRCFVITVRSRSTWKPSINHLHLIFLDRLMTIFFLTMFLQSNLQLRKIVCQSRTFLD